MKRVINLTVKYISMGKVTIRKAKNNTKKVLISNTGRLNEDRTPNRKMGGGYN